LFVRDFVKTDHLSKLWAFQMLGLFWLGSAFTTILFFHLTNPKHDINSNL
jgi:hypothetical protein